MAEEDIEKTAFTSHARLFEYTRKPFGISNARATFQRALDVALAQYKRKYCLFYIDDVVVFSKSIEAHIEHVDEVLTVLREACMSLKFKKCEFFLESIKNLGHIIRPGTLEVDAVSTKDLREASHPTTITDFRTFLGAANCYRRPNSIC